MTNLRVEDPMRYTPWISIPASLSVLAYLHEHVGGLLIHLWKPNVWEYLGDWLVIVFGVVVWWGMLCIAWMVLCMAWNEALVPFFIMWTKPKQAIINCLLFVFSVIFGLAGMGLLMWLMLCYAHLIGRIPLAIGWQVLIGGVGALGVLPATIAGIERLVIKRRERRAL